MSPTTVRGIFASPEVNAVSLVKLYVGTLY